MGIREGTTDYYLKRPFMYNKSGQSTEATFITLREPTAEHQEGFWVMRQYIKRAEVSAMKLLGVLQDNTNIDISGTETERFHEKVDKQEDQDPTKGDDAFGTIILSGDVDVVAFMNTFKKMVGARARKMLALVDGDDKVPLNQSMMKDKMHPDDLLNLAIRWCSFFVMQEDSGGPTSSDESHGQHAQVREV